MKKKAMILVNEIKYEKQWKIESQVIYYIVYKKWFRWRYYGYKHIWLLFPYIFLNINDAHLVMDEHFN